MNEASTPYERSGSGLRNGALADEVPLIDAAGDAFCLTLSDEGVKSWANRDQREG
jgi:hypothetical protein